MIERWLPVVGHEGSYEVSDRGGVRSIERLVARSNGTSQWQSSVSLRQRLRRGGYLRVELRNDGRRRDVGVHRLVLEAFVGPCPPEQECCHGPGGPADNRLENLRWDTKSANSQDRISAGTDVFTRKFGERTHCVRSHELNDRNNLDSRRARGYRKCLACARAYSRADTQRRRGVHVHDMWAAADAIYAEIMNEQETSAA